MSTGVSGTNQHAVSSTTEHAHKNLLHSISALFSTFSLCLRLSSFFVAFQFLVQASYLLVRSFLSRGEVFCMQFLLLNNTEMLSIKWLSVSCDLFSLSQFIRLSDILNISNPTISQIPQMFFSLKWLIINDTSSSTIKEEILYSQFILLSDILNILVTYSISQITHKFFSLKWLSVNNTFSLSQCHMAFKK
jgi:hypothetical protein